MPILLPAPAAFPHLYPILDTLGSGNLVGGFPGVTNFLSPSQVPCLGSKSFTASMNLTVAAGQGIFTALINGFDALGMAVVHSQPIANLIALPGGASYLFHMTINAEGEGYYQINTGVPFQDGTVTFRYGSLYALQFGFSNDLAATAEILVSNLIYTLR